MNGVTNITASNYNSVFNPTNGASSLPNIFGAYAINYLDSSGAHGRRCDLNFYPPTNMGNDVTTSGITRMVL